MSAPISGDEKGDDPYLYAPRWARNAPQRPGQPTNSNLSNAPPLAPDAAGFTNSPTMAPGIGGYNIDPPAAAPSPFEGDFAIKELRRRLSLDPSIVPEPPVLASRRQTTLPFGWLAIGFAAVATLAFSVALIWFTDGNIPEPKKQESAAAPAAPPLVIASNQEAKPIFSAARLLVEPQQAAANEPLPLGIVLKDGSGGEKLTLAGLAAGTKLSAGTPLGLTGWQVSARDAGQAFAYAPKDFVGAMDAVIDLRSATDRLMDSQVLRLEWIKKKFEPPAPPPVVAKVEPPTSQTPPMVIQPLETEEVANLVRRGQDLLKSGDISSARLALRRAANAGSAQAALALGASYDPFFLEDLGVLGFAPDLAQARAWYRRAVELGSPEAPRRLDRLSSVAK